jgi:hypothetical protein
MQITANLIADQRCYDMAPLERDTICVELGSATHNRPFKLLKRAPGTRHSFISGGQ